MDNKMNIIQFENFTTPGKPGKLSAINSIDFATKRIFYVQTQEESGKRGIHANKNFDELLFVLNGGILLETKSCIDHSLISVSQSMNSGNAYIIPKNTWIEYMLQPNTTIVVLTNKPKDDSESIFDYDTFVAECMESRK